MCSFRENGDPADFHIFILWRSREKSEKKWFVDRLARRFSIIEATTIEWRSEVWESSLTRLYNDLPAGPSSKVREIGYTPFLAVVCKDDNPAYGISQSLGGEVEKSNLNVIECKREIRNELDENRCHSTSNSEEFMFQASLLFGVDRVDRIIEGGKWDGEFLYERRDLAGTDGWGDAVELFQVLNRSNRWVVLRNFEGLPEKIHDKNDVDVLVEDLERFVSAANARIGPRGFGRYWVRVAGVDIPFDVRCVADGYYDSLWESEILRTRKVIGEYVPIPCDEHLFFSLLYHVKVHKKDVDEKYFPVLDSLARDIGFREFSKGDVADDSRAASIVSGFMRANRFGFSWPVDDRVEMNRTFVRMLRPYRLPVGQVMARRKVLNHLRKLLPLWSYQVAPRWLRRSVKRALNR